MLVVINRNFPSGIEYFILLPRLFKIFSKNLPALKEPALTIESGVNILKVAVEAIEKRSNIQTNIQTKGKMIISFDVQKQAD